MVATLRFLLALAIAALLAMPIVSGDGGENGGGTGIWILPRATFLAGGCSSTPVDQKAVPSLAADLVMQVSTECGSCTASLVDDVSGVPVSLTVVGNRVRLPASLLQALGASAAKASLVILDAQGYGYSMSVSVSPASGVLVKVY